MRPSMAPCLILHYDVIAGYKTGANSYIREPVDFKEFVEAIKLLGLYWLIWNEPPPLGK